MDLSSATRVAPSPDALDTCLQRGGCTASWPTANRMMVTPNRKPRLIKRGVDDDVLMTLSQ